MTQDEQSNHGVKEAREHRHVLAGLRQVMGFRLNPVTEVKESKDTDVNSTSHTVKDTRGTSSHSEGAVRTTGTSHKNRHMRSVAAQATFLTRLRRL